MKEPNRDTSIKTAWITGGLALVGTVVTLIFTGPLAADRTPDQPSSPPSTASPSSPITTGKVPAGVEGQWVGGGSYRSNLHLTISRDADYSLLDTDKPGMNAGKGKLTFDGPTVTFHDIDRSTPRSRGLLRRRRSGTSCTSETSRIAVSNLPSALRATRRSLIPLGDERLPGNPIVCGRG